MLQTTIWIQKKRTNILYIQQYQIHHSDMEIVAEAASQEEATSQDLAASQEVIASEPAMQDAVTSESKAASHK